MSTTTMMWGAFALLMTVMLVIDLGINGRSHKVGFREALTWTCVWVSTAIAFNIGVYYFLGPQKALEFLTGYIIEETLSIDNLFVFIMIFAAFGIQGKHQSRILKWGIIGALVMRALFVFLGVELLQRFHWLFYVFGAILIVTALKMLFGTEKQIEPEKNLVVRIFSRLMPVTKKIEGEWFVKRINGVLTASPLLLALVMVETTDVIFALDSIPAIFAVTTDPFIVFTSNIFAIMGLRTLYFLLANVMELFIYLKTGVAIILAFVGVKMLLAVSGVHIPIGISLGVIVGTVALSVIASVVVARRRAHAGNLPTHRHDR